jgi:hypothetical protein
MSQTRSWLPKVLVESLLIVFSILLALAVDEWREDRQTEKRVAQALESFTGEIQRNRKAVAKVLPYHELLHRHFLELAASGKVRSAKDFMASKDFKGFAPVSYESTVWRTAVATGILTDLDFETASRLSRLYTVQDDYASQQKMVFGVLQPSAFTESALPRTLDIISGHLMDTVIGERALLKGYDAALKRLEELKRKAR